MKNFFPVIIIIILPACSKEKEPDCLIYFGKASGIYTNQYLIYNDPSGLDSALMFVNQWLACKPDSLMGITLKAKIQFSLKQYDSALTTLRITRKHDRHPAVSSLKGYVFDRLQKTDSSDHYFRKSIREYDSLLQLGSNDFMTFVGKMNVVYKLQGGKTAFEMIDAYAREHNMREDFAVELKKAVTDSIR